MKLPWKSYPWWAVQQSTDWFPAIPTKKEKKKGNWNLEAQKVERDNRIWKTTRKEGSYHLLWKRTCAVMTSHVNTRFRLPHHSLLSLSLCPNINPPLPDWLPSFKGCFEDQTKYLDLWRRMKNSRVFLRSSRDFFCHRGYIASL